VYREREKEIEKERKNKEKTILHFFLKKTPKKIKKCPGVPI
jgi:hypothetical protein